MSVELLSVKTDEIAVALPDAAIITADRLTNRRPMEELDQENQEIDSELEQEDDQPLRLVSRIDHKKYDDAQFSSFPVSTNGCCASVKRLLTHKLVDTDDLILHQERRQLHLRLQPVEEEEPLNTAGKYTRAVVELFLCMLLLKQPTSCHPKSSASTWFFRFLQIMFLVYWLLFSPYGAVAHEMLHIACIDSQFLDTRATDQYHCPVIQAVIKNSNYTQNITGYPGALLTMKALTSSDLDSVWQDKFNIALSVDDPSDASSEWITARNEFLFFRATTGNVFIPFLFLIIALAILGPIVAMQCSMEWGVDELMFPALLEMKQHSTPLSELDQRDPLDDVESVGRDVSNHARMFHFVRPRTLVLELACITGLMGFPVMYVCSTATPRFPTISSVFGPGFFCMLTIVMCGLFVQIHNGTTLANMLVQMCGNVHDARQQSTSVNECQARFDVWKEYYKTTVGALHVWSWRATPVMGSIVAYLGLEVIMMIMQSIAIYSTVASEADVVNSSKVFQDIFWSVGVFGMIMMFFFLMLISAMSLVYVRYQRLYVLVATLRLPAHRLEDFSVLQKNHAALTIFDVPITTKTALHILQLLFVQAVLLALSMFIDMKT